MLIFYAEIEVSPLLLMLYRNRVVSPMVRVLFHPLMQLNSYWLLSHLRGRVVNPVVMLCSMLLNALYENDEYRFMNVYVFFVLFSVFPGDVTASIASVVFVCR